MIDRNDRQWYRDAVIYQVHVKSFFDSNNNGIGDFVGLTQKLDYIKDLGATAIWVMPFFPSPLRDDGYDIADYRGINPAYGDMRDFRRFVRAAHDRGIRVIIELVINHTSDQHPWFQRARRAKPGSTARDFYVWSDTDKKYPGVPIIFLDTEQSNWSWDPVAEAYYWHRFYSHQPDLNFDNPRVLEAVLDTMRFWLDMGVDGLRLDAIPYLIERDGTLCENLPETHDIIRRIRAEIDKDYPDRMLLAEANLWPEEAVQYFGADDECHMAFHFPLMPRMYMAIAREDRHPITDILRQTPELPDGAQWAIFLRNHDELTLATVTDRERDYLWSFYATDRRARFSLGIRRRLAPLLENDRRKIELMVSLLLSMPGTPILYYGDEIGMGDNIYLGDRDGVRTPMQWSPDRNGGFSLADPARLYLPAIQDPTYGFEALNVEAQVSSPHSLLNWTRRMLAVRKGQTALSRGTLRFLYPTNRKVLAYVREQDGSRILCVANVSRGPQAVELDLSDYRDVTPVEMSGGSVFPPIGESPYLLTLPAYGFYWFRLTALAAEEQRFSPPTEPDLFTLVLSGGLETCLAGRERIAFENTVVPSFLGKQWWFAGKRSRIESVRVEDFAVLRDERGNSTFLITILNTHLRNAGEQRYFLPLAFANEGGDEPYLAYGVARARRGSKVGLLYDAASSPDFALSVLAGMESGREIATAGGGLIHFAGTMQLPRELSIEPAAVRRLSAEQANSSTILGDKLILKFVRNVHQGIQPAIEMGRYLTETVRFPYTPALCGSVERIGADGAVTGLMVMHRYIANQGDAGAFLIDTLKREFDSRIFGRTGEDASIAESMAPTLALLGLAGQRIGELHLALAQPTDDPAFASEALTEEDMRAATGRGLQLAEGAFAALETALFEVEDADRAVIDALLPRRSEVDALIRELSAVAPGALKTRVHGDLHLAQLLVVHDDVVIVDFDGEPGHSIDDLRRKQSPLRDVASMLRSIAYVSQTAVRDFAERFADSATPAARLAAEWEDLACTAFLRAYENVVARSPIWLADREVRERLLRFHLLQRALYEVIYEAGTRPGWIGVPARGVLDALGKSEPAQRAAAAE